MPQSEMVDVFQGLRHGRDPVGAFSPRGPLDTPRELLNFLHDEHGQLWLPKPAASPWLNFGAGLQIRHLANVAGSNIGTALIIQLDNEVHIVDTSTVGATPVLLISDVGSDRIWVNAMEAAVYVGTGQNTWKITKSGGVFSAAALGSAVPHGFHSLNYKGRRFVMQRPGGAGVIRFSEINQPETFLEDSTFSVGGDQTGGTWSIHPGSPVVMVEHEDVLLLFLTQSVWALTGSTPANFNLRRTASKHGCWARDTVVNTDDGILFLGGTPNGEMGVHLFTGNQAVPVGEEIGGYFRDWSMVSGDFTNANRRFTGVRWRNRYILTARGPVADRSVFVYDLTQRKWSTFGGWSQGPAVALLRSNATGSGLDQLMMTNGNDLYLTEQPIMRAPSAPNGKVTVGWHDQGSPAGHLRFLGLKVGAWQASGGGDLTVTASVPLANKVAVRTTTTEFHDHAVIPINLRGKAVLLELDLASAGEALLESIELISSRKGSKLSRG